MDDFNLENITDTSTIEEGADETSFGGMHLSDELLQSTVNDYYDTFQDVSPIGRDYSKFEIEGKGILRLRGEPGIDLLHKW